MTHTHPLIVVAVASSVHPLIEPSCIPTSVHICTWSDWDYYTMTLIGARSRKERGKINLSLLLSESETPLVASCQKSTPDHLALGEAEGQDSTSESCCIWLWVIRKKQCTTVGKTDSWRLHVNKDQDRHTAWLETQQPHWLSLHAIEWCQRGSKERDR